MNRNPPWVLFSTLNTKLKKLSFFNSNQRAKNYIAKLLLGSQFLEKVVLDEKFYYGKQVERLGFIGELVQFKSRLIFLAFIEVKGYIGNSRWLLN